MIHALGIIILLGLVWYYGGKLDDAIEEQEARDYYGDEYDREDYDY